MQLVGLKLIGMIELVMTQTCSLMMAIIHKRNILVGEARQGDVTIPIKKRIA